MPRITYHPGGALFVKRLPWWKRSVDLLLAGTTLACLLPLLALIAALIAVVSPGPVFFRQWRLGRGGEEFLMWKFRTMHLGVDPSVHERAVGQEIATNATLRKIDTPGQLIPLGVWLRKSCLDELPQLLNVLRGEMSLVGPRPDPAYAAGHYLPWHRARLDVLPGITGLWQVSGKNRTTFRRMLELDRQYADHQSLVLDLRIIVRTPGAILAELRNASCRQAAASDPSLVPPPAGEHAAVEAGIER